ncbi:hypothetical protein Hdeb2414_s0020g00562151 [Helianthus debilis subsp. tardiflorus]
MLHHSRHPPNQRDRERKSRRQRRKPTSGDQASFGNDSERWPQWCVTLMARRPQDNIFCLRVTLLAPTRITNCQPIFSGHHHWYTIAS